MSSEFLKRPSFGVFGHHVYTMPDSKSQMKWEKEILWGGIKDKADTSLFALCYIIVHGQNAKPCTCVASMTAQHIEEWH
jgi:lysine/ornithine N-monooxygenase